MAAEDPNPPPSPRAPLTDSPWFWLGWFSLIGLVALVAMAPRYRQRQAQLDRQFYARQMGGQSVVGPSGPARPQPGSLLIPLTPIAAVLTIITAVCWTQVLRQVIGPAGGRQTGARDEASPAAKERGP